MKERSSGGPIAGLLIAAAVLLFLIFGFDYKKDDFTLIHSIIGIVAMGVLGLSISKLENKE